MTMTRLKYGFKISNADEIESIKMPKLNMKLRALKCQNWIWNLEHKKAKIEYEFKETLDKQNCYQWIKNSKALNGTLIL